MKPPKLSAALPAVLAPLAAAVPAQAADGERTPVNLSSSGSATHSVAGSSGTSLVQTFVGLAIVIGVIYGLYWVLKQVKASREEKASGRGLAPVATMPLGAGRSLHIVRAGRDVVLLGVTEKGVTPIKTYHEEEAERAGLLDAGEEPAAPSAPARPAVAGVVAELRRLTVRR